MRYQEDVSAMVTMTSSAAEKVQDFIQEHGVEGDAGLRVAVLPGGCSGFQYGLNVEDGPEADDEVRAIMSHNALRVLRRTLPN